MNTQPIMVSPQMEQLVKDIAVRHTMDWTRSGVQLHLAMPGYTERWLLMNLDGERFSVTCYLVEPNGILTPEVDMVFEMHPIGWEPIELMYSQEVFDSFLEEAQTVHLPVYDADGNLYFDSFTEYYAKKLQVQGWVEHGQLIPEPASGGRMVGCQSTNHAFCYGELWQCVGCGKTVCYAEGTDNHPELCDDCWVQYQAEKDEWETQVVTRRNHQTLQLVCDCPAQCGTVLKLTQDGFLVLEDKDGLLVSFMLPDWLDFAIRRGMLAHTSRQPVGIGLGSLEDDVPF